MKAVIFNGPRKIELGERPGPKIQEPTDAVVRVVLGCVCGSDLWYYRGLSPHALGPIGHEFIGVVEEVGSDIHTLKKGDFVVAPMTLVTARAQTAGRDGRQTVCTEAHLETMGLTEVRGRRCARPLLIPHW